MEAETHPQPKSCFKRVDAQVLLMGLVFFGTCGAFNSILGLKIDVPDDDKSLGLGLLYFVFSISCFFTPAMIAKLGPRTTLFLATLPYGVYMVSLMLAGPMQAIPSSVIIVTGACVGLGAAPLWGAQGMMTLAYSTPRTQGAYFSTFWVISNLGSVFSGLQTFATNLNPSGDNVGASTTTFLVYLVVYGASMCCVWALQPLGSVVREDGVLCKAPESKVSLREELRGMMKMLSFAPVLSLVPLFVYSNWFYAYQTAIFFKVFDPAASGLANAIYWGAQMIGAKVQGSLLDSNMSVGKRAWISATCNATLIGISWLWGIAVTYNYDLSADTVKAYAYNEPALMQAYGLAFVWGFCDALVQNWAYWVMTVLFKSSEELSRVVSIYKAAQSAGSAFAFVLDRKSVV